MNSMIISFNRNNFNIVKNSRLFALNHDNKLNHNNMLSHRIRLTGIKTLSRESTSNDKYTLPQIIDLN